MKLRDPARAGRIRCSMSWLWLGILAFSTACDTNMQGTDETPAASLDAIAEGYVKLALALRPYDGDYVDAYYGPLSWADAAAARETSLDQLVGDTDSLLARLAAVDATSEEVIVQARKDGLEKRLRSMRLRMEMASGQRLVFDDESRVLFDAVAPPIEVESFRAVLAKIDSLVPGNGNLEERLNAFRDRFQIPVGRLSAVFDAAIAECRRRTREHIALPEQESFRIEYVTNQPWSGYNWYEGNNHSLIQINTELPIYIDRAVDLGCHEGYPGHHTYNILTETQLVNARGWVEFALNPLFGPLSLISEGSANYGIELAFSDDERRAFERDVLFPLAGLATDEVDAYYDLLEALRALRGVEIAVARDYLNGRQSREQTIARLREFTLASEERASQRVRFFDAYRSYVINYSFGRDLIAAYIEREAGDARNVQWRIFEQLLSRPASPSDLR